ncbi:MAG TPA: C2 family cysteine protease, partial [Isosphaeraceae bacterium]|nr:C2 family cysteine protease [Isosphaeraceae bacterium]
TWAATAGTITTGGLFTAPTTTGGITVTATSGSFKGSASVNVTKWILSLQDQALANLVQSLDADGSISRLDMIQILDSIGSEDGVVDAAEFGDLKTILNNAAMLKIPGYVDVLAGDVVNGNPANAYFQGQVLGNLAAGSSASQLKELVSKWFLGADHPAAYYYDQYGLYHQCQYSSVAGSLFVNGPAYTDMHQGELGDCYLISALGSLAKSSPAVIQNMIIDNGDNTWTVRFYANGTPDYVTVDRMLPTENGNLVFDDYGASPSNAGNVLWIPLVEKAYAEWNETGKEGRDGQNSYWSIGGGASGDVYTQILGHSAQYYTFPGFTVNGYMPGTEQTMINAISSNEAVTIDTYQAGNGLYASHVYMVVGYTMATDTFQLYNPWGVDQPGPLTWTQLSADCEAFWAAGTSGTVPIGSVAQAPLRAGSVIPLPALPSAGALDVPSGRVSVLTRSPSQSAPAMTDHVASLMAKSSIAKTPAAFPTAGTDAFGVSLARVSRPHKTLTRLSPLAVDELFLDTDFLAG